MGGRFLRLRLGRIHKSIPRKNTWDLLGRGENVDGQVSGNAFTEIVETKAKEERPLILYEKNQIALRACSSVRKYENCQLTLY